MDSTSVIVVVVVSLIIFLFICMCTSSKEKFGWDPTDRGGNKWQKANDSRMIWTHCTNENYELEKATRKNDKFERAYWAGSQACRKFFGPNARTRGETIDCGADTTGRGYKKWYTRKFKCYVVPNDKSEWSREHKNNRDVPGGGWGK